MNELALFAGAGGGILGGHLLGWRTVCAVEWEAYPASVLCARQNDGLLPPFPIWDDVQTFDGKPWRGIVDVVSGGFPCQDISVAGKGAGIEGNKSSMWKHMARIIYEVRPKFVFVENSPILTSRGLGVVLADLAKMGFDAEWGVLSAADVGANHKRERIWILAYSQLHGLPTTEVRRSIKKTIRQKSPRQNNSFDIERASSLSTTQSNVANSKSQGLQGWNNSRDNEQDKSRFRESCWSVKDNWVIEPNVGRVANGVAARVDRIKALGNGQVPLCAATAWRLLNERL